MDSKKIFALLVLGFAVLICYPLLLPVTMGGIFAVLFFPLLERLEKRKFSTGSASALISCGITVVIFLPSLLLIYLAAKTGLTQLRIMKDSPVNSNGNGLIENFVQGPVVKQLIDRVSVFFPVEVSEIVAATQDLAKGVALKLADALGTFVTHLPSLMLGLVIMVISTFFFLVDGRKLASFVRTNSPFEPRETERLILVFTGTCRSVILATVASGLAQAILFGLVCALAATGNALLISALVFIGSFIPLVGSAPVTLGVTLHTFLSGRKAIGVLLLICALIVGVMDNFIRPAILKGSANLHPLLAFVSVFGGLQLVGFPGLFLGPIVAALAVFMLKTLTQARTS